MSPNNTPNNALAGIGSAPNKSNTSAANKNTNKTAPAFNALFGQAIEKKQGAQNLLSNKSNSSAGFGDEFRSDPQRTPERNAANKANSKTNNKSNIEDTSVAQSLAAQQMASTNAWAQTQAAPKANDQEWQTKANTDSKAMQSPAREGAAPKQNSQTQSSNNESNSDNNNPGQTNNAAQANSGETQTTNQPPANTSNTKSSSDETADRINQITQAVLQGNEGFNTKLPANTLSAIESNPISNETTPSTTLAANGLTSTGLVEGQLQDNSTSSLNNTGLQNGLQTTPSTPPLAVQQVMAQREALYSVSGNADSTVGAGIGIENLAANKAASLDPSNSTPSPMLGVLPNSTISNTSNTQSISTRIGTPIGQPGFAKELGHTVQWAIGKSISTVDIRINPESFGPLNMRIVQKGQDIQLIIRTQDEQSATMLQQAIGGLKESLSNQGLQLNQVNIQHGQSNPQNQTSGSSGGGASGNPSFSDQSKPNRQHSQSANQQDDGTMPSTTAAPSTNSRAGVGGVDMFA